MDDRGIAALGRIVGDAHVLVAPDLRAGFERDWTGRHVGRAAAVVRPGHVEEVAAVLAWCDANGIGVVPQGGNSGLVAGGVPVGAATDAVVLSLVRLTALGAIDAASAQVTAGAGVTLARLDAHAGAAGLAFGVDFGSRDVATVGGAVATNAGGLRVVRFGMMRDQLLGVEAVLADGRIVSDLRGLVKDNTGYALHHLLCGSEGTLAVVTAARLRLVPRFAQRSTALVGFTSLDDAVVAAARWRRRLADLDALEVVRGAEMATVAATLGLADPFEGRWPVAVLVECAAHDDPSARLADALMSSPEATEVVAATGPGQRGRLWRIREEIPTVIARDGPPHKFDVSLPLGELSGFVRELESSIHDAAPKARLWVFGHLGDGNLHVNLTGLEPDDDTVDGLVADAVARHGGSISAEHGIGRVKAGLLHLRRDPVQLAVFRALKAALDPNGILNPGVLLPDARGR